MRNEFNELLYYTTIHDGNFILHMYDMMYTSAVRFFEGQLPHNTIIPDHYE